MRSFEAAERALDADHLIEHFAPVADFHVYNDGQRLDYETVTANLRSGFPSLRSIEGGFHDMRVIVLASDAALGTAGFREVITDTTGASLGCGSGFVALATNRWELEDRVWAY